MKSDKFKELFDHANDIYFGGQNDRVVVVTNNPAVGGRYRIPVSSVTSGFDWENGDIIIGVDEKIVSQEFAQKADISKFIHSIPTKVWEKIRGSKGDAECRKNYSNNIANKINKFNKN